LKNITVQDSSITVGVDGIYSVVFGGNGRSVNATAGSEVHAHLYVNDVKQVKEGTDGQISNSGVAGRWTWGGNRAFYSLKKNDIIKIKIQSPDDASCTIILQHFDLTAQRIE